MLIRLDMHPDSLERACNRLVAATLKTMSMSMLPPQVHFNSRERKLFNMDEAFGRAAHVAFLDHVPFLRMFAVRYAHFFED